MAELDVPFTSSTGVKGEYHYWPAPNRTTSTGVLIYLDGDGQWGHDNHIYAYALGSQYGTNALIQMGHARNLDVISVRTPEGANNEWWRIRTLTGPYFAEVFDHLMVKYGVNRNRVWLVGYSGGAQFITQTFLPQNAAKLLGGGTVVIGGGGSPMVTVTPFQQSQKDNLSLHWVTGREDIPTATDAYDGYGYAQKGIAYYAGLGFNVSGYWPVGVNHKGVWEKFGLYFAEAYDWATR